MRGLSAYSTTENEVVSRDFRERVLLQEDFFLQWGMLNYAVICTACILPHLSLSLYPCYAPHTLALLYSLHEIIFINAANPPR